jgi:hypothetical protein
MKIRLAIVFILLSFCKASFCQTTEIYTDTLKQDPYEFWVNKTKFRFKLNIEEYKVAIERFNATWTLIDSAEFFQQILLKDINKDGYLDIGFYQKWTADVWLFNSQNNTYIHSGDYPIMEFRDNEKHMILLDKKLQVYYDYSWYKRGSWTSTLFIIKDYKRVELGAVYNNTEFSKEADGYVTTSVMIDKVREIEDEQIKEMKWTNKVKFDYATYWKQNWRKFLPK